MSRIRLYFDEDAMQHALVIASRARRVDALTASDCGMVGRSDEEHLCHASNDGRVLYSFNIRDYSLLHEQWIASGGDTVGSFSHSSSATPSVNNYGGYCSF
jgi:hypothetical protein